MTGTAVITLVHGRAAHLRTQHEALRRSTLEPDDYIVVAIDDPFPGRWDPPGRPRPHVVPVAASTEGLPLAKARNLGARCAIARGADVLVFLDVDCLPDPGLVAAYATASRCPRTKDHLLCGPVAYLPPPPPGGYELDTVAGLAEPHPGRPAPDPGEVLVDPGGHRLFWSLSFAVGSETWSSLDGFDETYVGYGAEDTDFGQRAASQGVALAWVGGARSYHQHHPVSDPPVEHLDDIVRNATYFHQTWGFWPMGGWLDEFTNLGLIEKRKGRYVRLKTTK